MATETRVKIVIEADKNTGAVKAAGDELKVFGDQAKTAGQQAKSAAEENKGLADASGILSSKLTALLSTAAIAEFFREAVVESLKEAEALRTLQGAVETSGQSWTKYKEILEDYARVQQENTRFDSEETITTLTRLTRATKSVEEAVRATTLAENLASATNKPLAETTELVNSLLLGQQRAVIIATKEFGNYAGGAATAQQALDNLQKSVNGAAVSEESATKSFLQLKNEMGEVLKAVGGALTPAFVDMADAITDITRRTLELLGVTAKHSSVQKEHVQTLTEERNALIASASSLSAHAAGTKEAADEEQRLRIAIADKTKELDTATEALKKSNADQSELGRLTAQQNIADAQAAADKKAELQAKVIDETVQLTTDEFEYKRIKVEQDVDTYRQAGIDKNLIDSFRVASLADIDKKEIAAKKVHEKELQTLEKERLQNVKSTLNFIGTLASSKNKELAIIGKTAAIANATIQTYEAAAIAFKTGGGVPFGVILSALTVAAGLANVAKIAGVAPETGGVVPGTADGTRATIGEKGKAEAVIPLTNSRALNLIGRAISDAGGANGNVGGGGTTIINLNVNAALEWRDIVNKLSDEAGNGTAEIVRLARRLGDLNELNAGRAS